MGEGTTMRLAGSSCMRVPILLALLLLAACGSQSDSRDSQPGVVANIVDQAVPVGRDASPPANAIATAEAPPDLSPPAAAQPDAGASNGMPIALQGHWTGLNEACGDKGAAQQLQIRAASLIFLESVGTVKSITPASDGRLSVSAEFTGEGESWTRTLALRPSDNGRRLTITNDGTAIVRKRCDSPA